MRYSGLYLARHNSVVARIRNAAANKSEVLAKNKVCGSNGLRPDLVIRKNNRVFIIDVTIPFDNCIAVLDSAARERTERYKALSEELSSIHGSDSEVVKFVVGALGSWYPKNDELIRNICSPRYADNRVALSNR
ncbi:unnamed protein product [Macrosiphum euphorbiae]|uniref:Uncharacterized protein n=1 Tax=Macrosiphum euphorbiae TaxID=13131 RepID=A0AAV0WCS7_9HEMI|nr:unnamed protein product [Macrosiphum euphorbiae]